MQNRISEAFELAEKQLQIAEDFFQKEDIDNSLIYIWNCFENLINCLKDHFNNKPLYDHRPKIEVIKDFYLAQKVKQDYSRTFIKLISYRLVAEFGPYTKIPKSYTQKDVEKYLQEAKTFLEEVNQILKSN